MTMIDPPIYYAETILLGPPFDKVTINNKVVIIPAAVLDTQY